jgi:hypothetical protein
VVVAQLELPDARDLLVKPKPARSVAKLRRDAEGLRARLDELARLYAQDRLTINQLEAGSASVRERLAVVERELEAEGPSPLRAIAGRKNAADVWAGLPLENRRAIVRLLLDITVFRWRN